MATGDGGEQQDVFSAARFVIDFIGSPMGRIAFSELSGINSKVNSQEYIYSNKDGDTVHTKQFGKTDPPTITLKRGLDGPGNGALMAWHQRARDGDPEARVDGTLTMMGPSKKSEDKVVYHLVHAWCSELTIAAAKAGSSDVVTIECKITCEEIKVVTK